MKKRGSFRTTWGMLYIVGMAVCLLMPGQVFGDTVIIDDMTVQQGSSNSPVINVCSTGLPAQTNATTGPTANIYGGNRVLEVTHTAGQGACTKAYVDASTPRYWVVVNDTNSSGWGQIIWSGASTAGAFSLPPLDLTQLLYFNIIRVTADHPTYFVLELFSDASHAAWAVIVSYPNAGGGDSSNVQVPKANFATIPGYSDVDFSSIKEMRIYFTDFNEIDIGLRGVSAVTQNPPDVHCNYKTLNGSQQLTITNQPPPYPINVAFEIHNVGDTASQIVVEDTMPAGMVYGGPTTCAGGFVLGEPVQALPKLTWTSTSSLSAGATVVCQFPATLNSLDVDATKTNVLRARASGGTFGPEECQATVTRRQTSKVPSMNEWGAMLTFVILAAAGLYLARRKREA